MKKVKTYLMMALFGMILMGAFNTKASAARRFQMTRYEGHVYIRVDKNMKWTTADRLARSCGGHLVTINSYGEQKVVNNLIRGGCKNTYWMGGVIKNGRMRWSNGERVNYYNWTNFRYSSYFKSQTSYMQLTRNANPYHYQKNYFGKWTCMYNNNTYRGQNKYWSASKVGIVIEFDSRCSIRTINRMRRW